MKPSTLIIVIVILLIPVVVFIATRSSNSPSPVAPSPSPTPTASYVDPQDTVSATEVTLVTDDGNINLTLFPDVAPMTVKNFVTLGKRGYYNGTYFHRIIQDFMIQGGDPTGTGTGGQSIWGKGFPLEVSGGKKFVQGSLGMARAADPDSNGSQFFIVTATNQPSLDGQYTNFGQVADAASQAVVDKIAATPVTTGTGGEDSSPTVQVHITGFTIDQ